MCPDNILSPRGWFIIPMDLRTDFHDGFDNHLDDGILGPISPTFYNQLLRVQIPKAQKTLIT